MLNIAKNADVIRCLHFRNICGAVTLEPGVRLPGLLYSLCSPSHAISSCIIRIQNLATLNLIKLESHSLSFKILVISLSFRPFPQMSHCERAKTSIFSNLTTNASL